MCFCITIWLITYTKEMFFLKILINDMLVCMSVSLYLIPSWADKMCKKCITSSCVTVMSGWIYRNVGLHLRLKLTSLGGQKIWKYDFLSRSFILTNITSSLNKNIEIEFTPYHMRLFKTRLDIGNKIADFTRQYYHPILAKCLMNIFVWVKSFKMHFMLDIWLEEL